MWSFETLAGNVSYRDINLSSNNIINIGSNNFDLEVALTEMETITN